MKKNTLDFYVKKFDFLTDSETLNLHYIKPICRRRLSTLDKITLHTMNNAFTNDIQNIVFSSKYGEVDRLLKIINQYFENKEISPNTFSGSVHNYPVSSFLLNNKRTIPYTALSVCDHSISSGLIAAVISNYSNILFCYSDAYNDKIVSMTANLSKIPLSQYSKFTLKFEDNTDVDDNFENYINLFLGNINTIKSHAYTIERIS